MKQLIVLFILSLWGINGFAQILLEDKQGLQLANNAPIFAGATGINTTLIKLNTGDQSLGFSYIVSSKNFNPSNYRIHEFGVKAKSTDGFGAIFSNGQISPGILLSYGVTKVPLLKNERSYVDWAGINVSYETNKYSLFKRDTAFNSQFFSKQFKGLSISFNYNALINSIMILNMRVGYSRRNNFADLNAVEAEDITIIPEPNGAFLRHVIKKRTGREGVFREFDAYPMIFALTKATPTDSDANANKLRLGYTFYIKNVATKQDKPNTDAGIIFFLTKQDKAGIRSPVLGINIQASDPFDNKNVNNGLQNRLSVGLTTIFTL